MTDFLFDSISVALPMSAVIALLLLLFRLYGCKLSAKCRRAVWLIVILRLCVPFGVQSVPALFEITVPEKLTVEAEAAATDNIPQNLPGPAVYHTAPAPVTVVTPETEPVLKLPPPLEIAAYVYAAGIILFAAYKAVMYAVYVYGLERSFYSAGQELAALYSGLCGRLGIKRAPELSLSRRADSPMLYGFVRPRVVLPHSVSELPVRSLTGILTHELTHYKRGDLWVKLSATLVTALYWWNPLVHIAAARLSGECELACDECTLFGLDETARREYGSVMLGIIKSCRRSHGTLTTRFNPRKNAVKERFLNIMDMTKKKKGTGLIALALIICLIAGAVTGCTVGETVQEEVYERYGMKVPLPEEYNGKVMVADTLSENVIITVYQTAAYEKNENIGWLFSIVRHSETGLVSDADNPGGLRYFAKDAGWYYGLMTPTDVQADMSDAALAAEYEKLSAMAETVMADFIAVNGLETYISGNTDIDTTSDSGKAPAVGTAPPSDETATVFMRTQNGDMSYEELLTYPEAREVIVAQMNEILSGYHNGTLPNPIENYSESEPFRVSAVPSGIKLPRSVKWDELNVYIGNAMFPNPPIQPVYDDMYPYHVVLPLEGNWNLCVNAAVTSFERPENSTIQLFDLSFYYGVSYDKDDLQTYGFTEPYIHRGSLDDAVNEVVAECYGGAAYQLDWLNREMTFSGLKSKLLFPDGRYVALTFDIKRERGAESYIFTGAEEFDTVGASPYDVFVKYKIMIVAPSRFLTDKQRSQIYFELIAVTGLSDIPTFEQLFAGGNVSESGGSQPSMRIGFTDGSGRKIAVTLLRFTASGDPLSPETVTKENTWDDFVWKSVSCTINGKPVGEID